MYSIKALRLYILFKPSGGVLYECCCLPGIQMVQTDNSDFHIPFKLSHCTCAQATLYVASKGALQFIIKNFRIKGEVVLAIMFECFVERTDKLSLLCVIY